MVWAPDVRRGSGITYVGGDDPNDRDVAKTGYEYRAMSGASLSHLRECGTLPLFPTQL